VPRFKRAPFPCEQRNCSFFFPPLPSLTPAPLPHGALRLVSPLKEARGVLGRFVRRAMDRKVPRIPIARSRPPRSHPRNSQKNFLFRGPHPPPFLSEGTRSLSAPRYFQGDDRSRGLRFAKTLPLSLSLSLSLSLFFLIAISLLVRDFSDARWAIERNAQAKYSRIRGVTSR